MYCLDNADLSNRINLAVHFNDTNQQGFLGKQQFQELVKHFGSECTDADTDEIFAQLKEKDEDCLSLETAQIICEEFGFE